MPKLPVQMPSELVRHILEEFIATHLDEALVALLGWSRTTVCDLDAVRNILHSHDMLDERSAYLPY